MKNSNPKIKLLMFSALLVTLIVFSSCTSPLLNSESPPISPTSSTLIQITLNTPFTLKPGQSAIFDSNSPSKITFISVESDSRCALDVQCVWAGEATLNLEIEGFKPTSDNITASSITTIHNTISLGGNEKANAYTLELTDVAPYPNSGSIISPADYRATFKISENR